MQSFEVVILLMFASALFVGVASYISLPYHISLILGGILIGFTPGIPDIHFDPELILVIVLPPILYHAAFKISFQEFRRNWKQIFSLALGLVLVTTLVIGFLFKTLFPNVPWALAFAFGSIVSPPDAVAATAILRRFSINQRLLTILEGESLINDASALVLYRLAVVALLTGFFSFTDSLMAFTKVAAGGVFAGFGLGLLLQSFSRLYLPPIVAVIFSFTIPYVTYIFANILGFSGVLAVVISGLISAQMTASHHSTFRRVLGHSAWDIFTIFLNFFVFIIIGLQLRDITKEMSINQMGIYFAYACLITLVMGLIRMLWVYAVAGIEYLKLDKLSKSSAHAHQIFRNAAVIGWAGMRGIVSLVAALALPILLPDGTLLEGRNETIFIVFSIILITLLIPSFSLAPLISFLKVRPQIEHHRADKYRKELSKVAERVLQNMLESNALEQEEHEFLKNYFVLKRRILEVSTSPHKKPKKLEAHRLTVIREMRTELLRLWESLEIDDQLLASLEHELDIEEIHTMRAELR